uniref:Uncharacterized protein n=1 Tax=Anguilla anguilla TaxID=7936 RepID=A0A0E9RS39_ANGAN
MLYDPCIIHCCIILVTLS